MDEVLKTYERAVKNVRETIRDICECSPKGGSPAGRDDATSELLSFMRRAHDLVRLAGRYVASAHAIVMQSSKGEVPEAFVLHRTALLAASKACVLLRGTSTERLTTSAALHAYDLKNKRAQVDGLLDDAKKMPGLIDMANAMDAKVRQQRAVLDSEVSRLGLCPVPRSETATIRDALNYATARATSNDVSTIGLWLWRNGSGFAHAASWPTERWGVGHKLPDGFGISEHASHAGVTFTLLMQVLLRADQVCKVPQRGDAFRGPLQS